MMSDTPNRTIGSLIKINLLTTDHDGSTAACMNVADASGSKISNCYSFCLVDLTCFAELALPDSVKNSEEPTDR